MVDTGQSIEMQKCSFGDRLLAAKQTFKQVVGLNAFTTTDGDCRSLFETENGLKWKVWSCSASSLKKMKAVLSYHVGSIDLLPQSCT